MTETLVSGDLTSAANTSDGDPNLFSSEGVGLNVFSYTGDISSIFTIGEIAFSGSATWTVTEFVYTQALAGASTGSIFFAADTTDDLPGASLIGEWALVDNVQNVSAPASLLFLSMGLLAIAVRRKNA